MTTNILLINASARHENSVSRQLAAQIVTKYSDSHITNRDLSQGISLVTEDWVSGTFTAPNARTSNQIDALSPSDLLVAEVQKANVIVIGTPIYNFNIPASLKAWIDLITRVGVTFQYGENGPEGLLSDKSVIVAVASGGTKIGSPTDFATPYLKFALGFIGLHDVTFVDVDGIEDLEIAA